MSNQYLSFWQNTFTDAFGASKNTDNFNNILNETISQIEEITSLFSTTDMADMSANFFKQFNITPTDYKKSFNNYIELFGLVSIEEYRSLIKKYNQLKKEQETFSNNEIGDKKKIAGLNKTISTQKETIANQTASLDTNKKEIDSHKKELVTNKKDIDKAKNEIISLKNELAAHKETIDLLEKKLIESNKKADTTDKPTKK